MTRVIRFSSFWENSERTEINFFLPLFQQVFQEEVRRTTSKHEYADLEITSVFQSPNRLMRKVERKFRSLNSGISVRDGSNTKSSLNVWFTGESIRPPSHKPFDAYLSYDSDDFLPHNLYLPLWVLNLSWFGKKPGHGFTGVEQSVNDLMQPRVISSETLGRKKFCCAFVNNPENLRMSVLRQLESIGQVDIFGQVSGKFIADKSLAARDYRFMMCFENKLYPGYVSEKLLEAYQSKTFPLYWGDDSQKYFNEKSFLNLNNFSKVSDYIHEIGQLNSNLDKLASRMREPLVIKSYDMDALITKLRLHLKIGL